MDVEVEQAQPLAPCRAGTVEGRQRGHTRFGARVSCAGRVGPWAKIAVTGLARSRDGLAGSYGGRSRLQRIKNGEHHGVLRKVRRSFEYGTFDGTLLCSELRRVIRESIVDSQSCHRGSHRSDLEGSGRATLAEKRQRSGCLDKPGRQFIFLGRKGRRLDSDQAAPDDPWSAVFRGQRHQRMIMRGSHWGRGGGRL